MADSNQRILLVCYYFPPLGGAGVSRPLQLFKKLPEFGYACDILTVKPVTYRVYEPELVPTEGTGRIYRSGSRDPQRLMHLLGLRRVSDETIDRGQSVSKRLFPDGKAGWVKPAVRLGRTIIENRRYSAIISTSPPISTHLVAMRLAEEFSLPWLADFRDLWTALPIEQSYDDAGSRKKGHQLLQRIGERATAISAVNSSVGEYVGASSVVSNGYDSDLIKRWRLPSPEEPCVIGVLGTVNELYPITPLMELICLLRTERPELYPRLQVLHAGAIDTKWLEAELRRYELSDRFQSVGRLDRQATIERLSTASLFYVATHPDIGVAFTTGRIFTLLPSGRPLLAYCHNKGELAKLIRSTANGHVFDLTTLHDAASWLAARIEASLNQSTDIELHPDYAEPYSDTAMAGSFAQLLEEITGEKRLPKQ